MPARDRLEASGYGGQHPAPRAGREGLARMCSNGVVDENEVARAPREYTALSNARAAESISRRPHCPALEHLRKHHLGAHLLSTNSTRSAMTAESKREPSATSILGASVFLSDKL